MDEQQTLCPECGTAALGAKFCPECGTALHDGNIDQTRVMDGSAAPGVRSVAPEMRPPAAASPSQARPRSTTALTIVALLALLLAAAGLAVGVIGFLKANSTQSQDRKLRASLSTLGTRLTGELAAAHQQLTTAQAAISNLKATSPTGAVSTLQGQMAKLMVCLPEVEQQINGLNVNTSNTGGYLTSAYINNPTITSSNCTKLLNGS